MNGHVLPTPTEGQPIPVRPELVDLASGQLHPRRLDVGNRTSPRFCNPRFKRRRSTRSPVSSTLSSRNLPDRTPNAWLALRMNQASRWFRARSLDRARPDRALLATPARSAGSPRAGARGPRRDRPQRARAVRRPPLRTAGGPCLRPLRCGCAACAEISAPVTPTPQPRRRAPRRGRRLRRRPRARHAPAPLRASPGCASARRFPNNLVEAPAR